MTDFVDVGFRIDFSDVQKALQLLQKLEDSSGTTAQAVTKIQTGFSQVTGAIDLATKALAGYLGYLGGHELLGFADNLTLIQNKLQLAGGSASDAKAEFAQIFQIAQDTRTPLEAVATAFTRIAVNVHGAGVAMQDIPGLVKTISETVQISGANALEARQGIIQFAQGLASARLQGQDLRAVLDELPRLSIAIATGLGVTVAQLRLLGQQGVLTPTLVLAALKTQEALIDSEFGKFSETVTQAGIKFKNAIEVTFGSFIKDSGIQGGLAQFIDGITSTITDKLFPFLEGLAPKIKAAISGTGSIFATASTAFAKGFGAVPSSADTGALQASAGQAIGQYLDDAVKAGQLLLQILGELTKIFVNIAPVILAALKPLFDLTSSTILAVLQGISAVLKILADNATLTQAAFAGLVVLMAPSIYASLVTSITGLIGGLKILGPLAVDAAAGFKSLATGEFFTSIINNLTAIYQKGQAAKDVFTYLAKTGSAPLLGSVDGFSEDMAKAAASAGGLNAVFGAIGTSIKGATVAMLDFTEAALANPLTWIAAAVVAVVVFRHEISEFLTGQKDMGATLSALWELIGDGLKSVVTWLEGLGNWLTNTLVDPLKDAYDWLVRILHLKQSVDSTPIPAGVQQTAPLQDGGQLPGSMTGGFQLPGSMTGPVQEVGPASQPLIGPNSLLGQIASAKAAVDALKDSWSAFVSFTASSQPSFQSSQVAQMTAQLKEAMGQDVAQLGSAEALKTARDGIVATLQKEVNLHQITSTEMAKQLALLDAAYAKLQQAAKLDPIQTAELKLSSQNTDMMNELGALLDGDSKSANFYKEAVTQVGTKAIEAAGGVDKLNASLAKQIQEGADLKNGFIPVANEINKTLAGLANQKDLIGQFGAGQSIDQLKDFAAAAADAASKGYSLDEAFKTTLPDGRNLGQMFVQAAQDLRTLNEEQQITANTLKALDSINVKPAKDFLSGLQDDVAKFADDFKDKGFKAVDDLGSYIKNTFKRLANELIFQALFQGPLSQLEQALGVTSQAQASGTSQGVGGLLNSFLGALTGSGSSGSSAGTGDGLDLASQTAAAADSIGMPNFKQNPDGSYSVSYSGGSGSGGLPASGGGGGSILGSLGSLFTGNGASNSGLLGSLGINFGSGGVMGSLGQSLGLFGGDLTATPASAAGMDVLFDAPTGASATGAALTGPSLLGGLLGGVGLGVGAGSILSAVGLSGKNASTTQAANAIGSAIGAAVGSIIPGLGTILGGLAGGVLGQVIGGFLGPAPTNGGVGQGFDPSSGTVLNLFNSKKGQSDQNLTNLQQGESTLMQQTQALAQLGIKFSENVNAVNIGNRDTSQIWFNPTGVVTPNNTGAKEIDLSTVGDVGDVAKAIMKELLSTATASDKRIQDLLSSGVTDPTTLSNIIGLYKQLDQALGTGAPALDAVGTALASLNTIVDQLRTSLQGAGQDTKAADDALAQGLKTIADTAVKGWNEELLKLQSPIADQLTTLLQTQAQRLDDVKQLGGAGADVVAQINSLELKQFADQVAQSGISIDDLNNALQLLTENAKAAGQSTDQIAATIDTAKGDLRDSTDKSVSDALFKLVNPTLYAWDQLVTTEQSRVDTVKALGGNLIAVEKLNALERAQFLQGLDAQQLDQLGLAQSAWATLTDKITVDLQQINLTWDATTQSIQTQITTIQQAAVAYQKLAGDIGTSISDIITKYQPKSPAANLVDLQTAFDTTATAAQTGDQTALGNLPQAANDLLTASRAMFGSSTGFQNDLQHVLTVLNAAQTTAQTKADSATDQITALQGQLDLLAQIKTLLGEPDPNTSILTGMLDQLNLTTSQGQQMVDLLRDYAALAAVQQGQVPADLGNLSAPTQQLINATSTAPSQDAVVSSVQDMGRSTVSALGDVEDAVDRVNDSVQQLIDSLTASQQFQSFARGASAL